MPTQHYHTYRGIRKCARTIEQICRTYNRRQTAQQTERGVNCNRRNQTRSAIHMRCSIAVPAILLSAANTIRAIYVKCSGFTLRCEFVCGSAVDRTLRLWILVLVRSFQSCTRHSTNLTQDMMLIIFAVIARRRFSHVVSSVRGCV